MGNADRALERHLRETDLRAINRALERGERVELIPMKDRVKMVRIRREELK